MVETLLNVMFKQLTKNLFCPKGGGVDLFEDVIVLTGKYAMPRIAC